MTHASPTLTVAHSAARSDAIVEAAADPRRWIILPVLLAGATLAPLDFFIVNVALPAIKAGLDLSAAQIQFVVAAYTVAYAVLLATGGRLGDLYGRKRMFVGGMVGFGLASGLCGLAQSAEMLIAGRFLQGVSAAIMVPQVLATIHGLFPLAERPRALGIFGAVFGFAAIVGQLAGGVLVAWQPGGLTWQPIFLVNLPICFPTAVFALWLMPDDRPERGETPDVPGIVLLTVTLLLLVYPAVEGREAGWPAWSLVALSMVLPCLAIFIHVERRQMARRGSALVDLRLFANLRFSLALMVGMLFYFASPFFLTFALYLEDGLGWAPLPTSLAILPFGFGFFVGPFATPALAKRLGHAVISLGFGLVVIGHFCTMVDVLLVHVPAPLMYVGLFCAGLGQGLVMPSLVRFVLNEARPEHAGLASGLFNTVLQIGATVSVATIGGVFFNILGPRPDLLHYVHAFAGMLALVLVVYLICLVLIFVMRRLKGPAAASVPTGAETRP